MYFWTSKNSSEFLSFSKEAFPNKIFSISISKPKFLMPRNGCILYSVYKLHVKRKQSTDSMQFPQSQLQVAIKLHLNRSHLGLLHYRRKRDCIIYILAIIIPVENYNGGLSGMSSTFLSSFLSICQQGECLKSVGRLFHSLMVLGLDCIYEQHDGCLIIGRNCLPFVNI